MKRLLTRHGNIRNKTNINVFEVDKQVNQVFKYWRKKGFPYYSTDRKFRKEKFDKFLRVNDMNSLDFRTRLLKPNAVGLSLCWSYFKHAFKVRCNKLKSPFDVWEDKHHFKYGLSKLIRGTFFTSSNYKDLMKDNEKVKQILLTVLRRVTGAQMVSNFRPVTASIIYKIFCEENDVVWDMSSGWGGRLLGSIKSKVNYIGTDPSAKTIQGNKQLAKEFGNKRNTYELHQCGSEEFTPDHNSLDFAFTSPPYFDTEKYSNEKSQSYIKFDSINKWKTKFLKKTIQNAYYGLKLNKFCVLNVADVKNYTTFERDTVSIAESVGFKKVDRFDYQLSSQQDAFKTEPFFIFKKI